MNVSTQRDPKQQGARWRRPVAKPRAQRAGTTRESAPKAVATSDNAVPGVVVMLTTFSQAPL